MPMSLADFRAHFPGLTHYVHANTCSRGAASTDVEEALATYLRSWREQGSPWGTWMQVWEDARAALAGLIGAPPHTLALTDSASHALAMAVQARAADAGPIVIHENNFPSAYHLADALATRGYCIRWTHAYPGDTALERTQAALPGAALLVLAHVHYETGELIDPLPYVDLASTHGCETVLDGYQALGIVPTDVTALGVTYYVSGTHKYLLGLEGFAFLYAADGHGSPAAPGWMAADQPTAMNLQRRTLTPDGRRFETGTPNVTGAYACRAALALLGQVDPVTRLHHVRSCVATIRAVCDQAGLRVVTPRAPEQHAALLSIASPDASVPALAMQQAGLVVSARGPVLRLSFHAYTSPADTLRLADWITAHPHLFTLEETA